MCGHTGDGPLCSLAQKKQAASLFKDDPACFFTDNLILSWKIHEFMWEDCFISLLFLHCKPTSWVIAASIKLTVFPISQDEFTTAPRTDAGVYFLVLFLNLLAYMLDMFLLLSRAGGG